LLVRRVVKSGAAMLKHSFVLTADSEATIDAV
jgi:hypothetical protein